MTSDLLKDLLAKIEDKDVVSTWSDVLQNKAEEEADRPTFWKRSRDPVLTGTVTKVYQKLAFDKKKMNPTLDIDGDDGRKWIWEITTKTFAELAAAKLVRPGDHVRQVHGKKIQAGQGFFWDGDDLIVTRDGVEVGAQGGDEKVPF